MTRIAAVGDLHVGPDSVGRVSAGLTHVAERADVLLLAGDLTRHGATGEAELVAGELAAVALPIVAVLGNHDHHEGEPEQVAAVLREAGVTVLDGTATVVDTGGSTLGIAGAKGFGGGFAGACATAFGEPAMKAFVAEARAEATRLHAALSGLHGRCDRTVALLHYSPVEETLRGERLELYPFLGSYLLAEAVDTAGADLIVHGHAHHGTERGVTPGGVRVRNVAQPVIGHAYRVFDLRDPAGSRVA
ncbi:MAG TPA: metallophosphoesterase [Acidimicrobiales bacterium]|nr:metallophosphoesterase [Acidimicrobiales bacterium]